MDSKASIQDAVSAALPSGTKAVRATRGEGNAKDASTHFALSISLRAIAIAALAYLVVHLLTTTQLYATSLVIAGFVALLIADLARVISRANREVERFLENLTTDVVETPLYRFAGQTRVVAAFERATHKLNAARSENQQALEYLQTLLDTVAAALIIVRADGRITLANRAARKWAAEDVDRLDAVSVIGSTAAHTLQTLAPGARQIVQLASGEQMLAAVAQFSLPDREAERLISLQRIAGELDAVELKAWQDMARVLAHEMMNSLTPIASLSESLELLLRDPLTRGELRSVAASDEIAGALEAIKRRSHGLMNFVERYRKLAELPQPRLQSIRMSEFFASIELLLSANFKARHIAYRSRVAPNDLHFRVDPELLEQAVINLVRNACDAVAETSQASIETSCELRDGQLVIAVADNGRGLPQQGREQIFVPFFTTKPDGSGIGLNLARHIALAHGGQLEARANQPCGSVFELKLPGLS